VVGPNWTISSHVSCIFRLDEKRAANSSALGKEASGTEAYRVIEGSGSVGSPSLLFPTFV